ncbi:MAG: hypothetical protein HY921_10315 [Elusimicrobia bacterium]|nr:hypothetical protein [Elusimicrobiota bacterium]
MKKGPRLILPALLLLAAPRLGAEPPASLELEGLGLSLGRGAAVAAPLTFDPAKARAGGFIYVPSGREGRDDEVVRMSEGILLAAGVSSLYAYLARAHRVPALSLSQARLEPGPLLRVEIPIYGAPRKSPEGYLYQVTEAGSAGTLKEGDVARLDALKGSVTIYSREIGAEELELFRAMRAYEGLRDAQSLIQWYEARMMERPSSRLGRRLLAELAARLGLGLSRGEDYQSARQAVERRLPEPERGALRGLERRLHLELEKAYLRQAAELKRALAEAASLPAAERLERESAAAWRRLGEASKALRRESELQGLSRTSVGLEKLSAARVAALKKIKALDWREAARAAGAVVPESAVLPVEIYRRFMAENVLSSSVLDVAQDASLDLKRKSERIREILTAPKTTASSPLGREILGRIPSGAFYAVSGAAGSGSLHAGAGGLLAAIQSAWASYWSPGPLGRRKREGLPLEPEAVVTVTARTPADASGILLTRDPVSGSRERALVRAVYGEVQGLVSEEISADEYVIDLRTGREAMPPLVAEKREQYAWDVSSQALKKMAVRDELAVKPCLSSAELSALARAARALESHFGCPLELEYSFSQGRLLLGLEKACEDEGRGKGEQ